MSCVVVFHLQVVDMRWGVREEASIDHSTSELCLKEIQLCNEVSIGPTFVVSCSAHSELIYLHVDLCEFIQFMCVSVKQVVAL